MVGTLSSTKYTTKQIVYRVKNKRMNNESVHLMQLLYTFFPHLSSQISIKMVDFFENRPIFPLFTLKSLSFSDTFQAGFPPVPICFTPLFRHFVRPRRSRKAINDDQIGSLLCVPELHSRRNDGKKNLRPWGKPEADDRAREIRETGPGFDDAHSLKSQVER